MKAGTDAMLLGAMAPAGSAERILDVGTGTGVLSLMLAQRSKARIDAIDIDRNAYEQAKENFENSVWRRRLHVYHSSLQEFTPAVGEKYDLIVSNPPYFPAHESSKSSPSSTHRKQARQTSALSFHALAKHVARLLDRNGVFYLVLPYRAMAEFSVEAGSFGLFPKEEIYIRSKPGSEPVRIIAGYVFEPVKAVHREFTIYNAGGNYSRDYIELTRAYHAVDF